MSVAVAACLLLSGIADGQTESVSPGVIDYAPIDGLKDIRVEVRVVVDGEKLSGVKLSQKGDSDPQGAKRSALKWFQANGYTVEEVKGSDTALRITSGPKGAAVSIECVTIQKINGDAVDPKHTPKYAKPPKQ
jgi:hypothetical protein